MVTGKGTGRGNNFSGEVMYMTNSPKLGWLNNSKGRIEGTSDMKNNEATMRVWLEKKQEAEAAPAMMEAF